MVTVIKDPVVKPHNLQPDSLEAWLENPLKGTEWVDGELIEKKE
ncbi:MAG: hypothetical protein ACFB0D_02565 [Phormidesmis sp.]